MISPLEALLLDLSLGGLDSGVRVGINKATAQLAVLLRGGLGGAYSKARPRDLGAARGGAVGVVDAAAGDELGAVTGTDALGTGVVGLQGESRNGESQDSSDSDANHFDWW